MGDEALTVIPHDLTVDGVRQRSNASPTKDSRRTCRAPTLCYDQALTPFRKSGQRLLRVSRTENASRLWGRNGGRKFVTL